MKLGLLGEEVASRHLENAGRAHLAAPVIESAGARQALKLQIRSGQRGQALPRWFETGFGLPWELSPSMKQTVSEVSGL